MLADNAFTVTLIVRLLPVGNNTAFSLLGGVASVRALPFLAGSAIGYVPQTLVFVLLGKQSFIDHHAPAFDGVCLKAGSSRTDGAN